MSIPKPADGRMLTAQESRDWFVWLAQQGFAVDRCGYQPASGTFFLNIESDEAMKPLIDAGFQVVRRLDDAPLEGAGRTQAQYFDPDEIAAMLAQVATDHPAITRVFSVGTTAESRTIWGIEISNNPGIAEDEPAIQFNAQHHAREVATSQVLMDVVETLTNGYGVDASITSWVDDYKTICVPMVNPDGVQFVFDGTSLWRKNREFYPPSCTGVDLNRNYPYRWGPDRCGSSSSCSGDTYKGPLEASEKETKSMIALANEFHFVMATSYHASGQFIDYPYACSNGSASSMMPEHDVIHEMMNAAADAIDAVDATPRFTVFSPASAGPLSGDDTSWYYAAQGVYSFIIEVGTSFEPSFSLVAGIVNRNRAGWLYMYDRLDQARIDVHVTDGCTGSPLEADITLTDYVFDTGESARSTFLPFGRWTFVVVANDTYTVRISKPGYVTQELPVVVGNVPVNIDVALQPDSACTSGIPTASTWGLTILALGLLAAGTIVFRGRGFRERLLC
ncbi:MAG: hypothetical protein IH987_03690 [Planctomycetes bacterium]|nr:hypothetical protein [Planctomycetota bacterium]